MSGVEFENIRDMTRSKVRCSLCKEYSDYSEIYIIGPASEKIGDGFLGISRTDFFLCGECIKKVAAEIQKRRENGMDTE